MITLGHKTSFIFVNRTISIHADIKNYTTGNNQIFIHQWNIDFSIVKTFCEMREYISFCKAKVHFSGVCDFAIVEIDLGIQMDEEEPEGGR